jgi:hydroxyacylglutathione hydrolase/adenylyltransferase/sulfurtransferase
LSDPSIEKSVAETKAALDAGEVQLVDVREPYEWEAGRIEGARHLELERLSSQAATIDRDRPVVFHCRAGVRSLMAAQAFKRAGFDAWSMEGGIQAWHDAGLPLVPEDGTVAPH